MLKSVLTAAAALSLVSVSSHAALVSGYGVSAGAATFPNCPSFCSGGSNERDSDGGEFATSATAQVDNTTASGFASGSFGGSAFTPVLRASADSPLSPATRGQGGATAIQGYTFTGGESTDFSLFVELDGTTTEPTASSEARISAALAVYILEDAPFVTDYGTLVFEIVPGEGGDVLANDQLFLNPGLGTTFASTTLDFTLNPGDEIYVFAQLGASAERGGSADATNTLTLTFDDASQLQAAVVPVPAAIWLFGSCLALLGWLKRPSNRL
jgi:hypothetical protein